MIPHRIDTKIILKVLLKDQTSRYIGPPCFGFLRWPTKLDFETTGKYVSISPKDMATCKGCKSSTYAIITKQDDSGVHAALIQNLHKRTPEIIFEHQDLEYHEVCYDMLYGYSIPMSDIVDYQLIEPIDKQFDDLTFEECEQINEKILSDLLPDLLKLKHITDNSNIIDRRNVALQSRESAYKKILSSGSLTKPSPVQYKKILKDKNIKLASLPKKIVREPVDVDLSSQNIPPSELIQENKFNPFKPNDNDIASLKNSDTSKGLGDTVKKITDKMGIKQCGGCKKRQEWLNKYFPYKK